MGFILFSQWLIYFFNKFQNIMTASQVDKSYPNTDFLIQFFLPSNAQSDCQNMRLYIQKHIGMDQSDWGINNDEEKSQQKSITTSRSKKRGQPSQQQEDQKQHQEPKKDELNSSNWLGDEIQEEPELTPSKRGTRGRPAREEQVLCSSFMKEKLADINTPNAELEPDTPNTSWFQQQTIKQETAPQRGNRQSNVIPKQQETQKRGNRGNRDNDRSDGFRKKTNFSDGNNFPENTSQNNWNERDNRESGFRGRGRGGYRGRGGFNNNYRENGNREGQQDQAARGNRYGNNNKNYRQKTEYEKNSHYNNGSNGVNYNNSGSSYNGNNGGNHYEGRNYNNNYNANNNSNNNYRRNYNNDFNQNKNYVEREEPSNLPAKIYQQFKAPVVQKEETSQNQPNISVPFPKGRKTWPEASIYIQKCKLTITYRQIHEFACKLLVIPYSSIKMEYYPGNIINSSPFDYKKKILSKGEEIAKPGHVYLQKALDISTLIGLAFLKIDQNRTEESLKVGVKEVLKIAQKIEKENFQSIIFPISDSLGDPAFMIRPLLQNLQNCRKIKEIYITTNQPKCFIEAMRSFAEQIDTLLKQNQIYID